MRPLELVLVVVLLVLGVVALRRTWRHHARLLGALALLAAVAQVVVEGQRWQLWPAYGAAGVAGLLAATGPRSAPASPRLTGLVAVLGALLGAAAATALPVPALALADAPVGTAVFTLTDPARTAPADPADPAGGGAGPPRRLPAQAWFPTTETDGPRDRVTHAPRAFAAAAGGWLGLPPTLLGHLGLARTAAHVGAAPAAPAEGLPVVVLAHGWGGFRKAQVVLVEALAARGHLVVALDHTAGSLAAEFPGGEVVPIDPRLLPEGAAPSVYDAASQQLERTFADDLLLAVADLASGDAGTPADVVAAADTDRLVLLGHSTGGGAAVWACSEEPRCDGVLGFDPWVEPLPDEVVAAGLEVPLVSLRSEAWVGNDNDGVLATLHAASPDERRLALPGTEHRDVTVLPLLTPLAARIGLSGPLDPTTTQEVAVEVAAAFLTQVLGSTGGDPALLDDPPDPAVLEVPAG